MYFNYFLVYVLSLTRFVLDGFQFSDDGNLFSFVVLCYVLQQNPTEINDSSYKITEEQEGDSGETDASRHCQAS